MLALFGVGDKWGLGLIAKHLGDSLVMGDGKKHKLTWLLRDTQSDSNRAGQVTSDLIMNDKVDLTVAPELLIRSIRRRTWRSPSALRFSAATTSGRRSSLAGGQRSTPNSSGCSVIFLGVDQSSRLAVQAANKIQSNKVVGFLVPNNADGQAFLTEGVGWLDRFKAAGYTTVLPSPFNPGTEDFTRFDLGLQESRLRGPAGLQPGDRLPELLEASDPARLPAEDGHRERRALHIRGHVGSRRHRRGPPRRLFLAQRLAVQGPDHRNDMRQLADDYEASAERCGTT